VAPGEGRQECALAPWMYALSPRKRGGARSFACLFKLSMPVLRAILPMLSSCSMPIKDLSAIELAKQVRAIKACTETDEELKGVLERLGLSFDDPRLKQVLQGLAHEDEFALLCRLMGTCNAINSLGQTPLLDERLAAPDFIASFRPALSWWPGTEFPQDASYQCLIEVKGTTKNTYSISTNDLERRLRFARYFRLPLVFAIRFMKLDGGMWLLLEAEKYLELKKSNRRLRAEDLQRGIGHILLDDYYVVPRCKLRMICSFNSMGNGRISRFGALEIMRLLAGTWEIEVAPGDREFVFLVLRTLMHRILEVKEDGFRTSVTYEIIPQARSISSTVSHMNRLQAEVDGTGPVDRARVLARLDADSNPAFLLPRSLIESVFFKYPGIFGRYAYENPDHFIPKMTALFNLGPQQDVQPSGPAKPSPG